MKQNVVAVLVLMLGIAMALWATLDGAAKQPLVTDARAMVIANSQSVMVTLKIESPGPPDRLIEARSDIAKLTVLKSTRAKGMPVPAATQIALTGEGGHIMLMGVQSPLDEGSLLPLELIFEEGGVIPTKARVGTAMMDHGTLQEVGNEPPPSVTLSGRPDGNGWALSLTTQNFRFARDLVDGPHVAGTGHAHLYIEGAKIGRLYEPSARIEALPSGRHVVRAALYTNDHKAYAVNTQPIFAEWEIIVP